MPEPIEILVKKGQTANDTTPESGVGEATAGKEQGKASIQQKAVNAALIGAGKQLLTNSVQQYGELTGDYASVETINSVLSIGADVATIAIGGPVGAVYVGSKYVASVISSGVKQYADNRETRIIRERAGYISKSGSRYTND